MDKELINRSNSKIVNIVSVEMKETDTDTILVTMMDEDNIEIIIEMDKVGLNGFRMAIASIMDVQPLILPLDKKGEYQCHYIEICVNNEGIVIFHKENGITRPLGTYVEIDDGMIVFSKDNDTKLWVSMKLEDALECSIVDKEYFTLLFKKEFLDEDFRKKLDKVFPFNRFGKDNKLSYGYFKSSDK